MIKTWTVGIAVLALAATPVFAEDSASDWSYDINVEPVGCTDCGDGCSDCGDGVGCGSACGGRGGLAGAIEGFTLSSLLGMDDVGIEVGGWTQFGYHDNQTPLSTTRGDVRAFNDVPDNLNLQQQWFYMGKQADGSRGFDWGFRADFLYGTDAQKTQAFGNPPGSFDEGFDNGVYGWAIPQLYGEIAMGDFSVIVGKFFTLTGFEVVAAPQNFFYSRSLTLFNTEPFTHTGVLTTYRGFDGITLYNGWTAGWDSGFDSVNSGSMYLGGFAVDLLDSVTMTYIVNYGNFGARDTGGQDSFMQSLVFDVTLTDNLQYVFQSDFLRTDVTNEDDIGINQYLIYKWNDLLSFGTRVEWWKNEGQSNYEATGGVNIHVLNNLVLRPEFRQDWNPATDLDEETLAVDAILTY